MSIWTLCGFILYSGVLIVAARVGCKRMDAHEKGADTAMENMNRMGTDIEVMKNSLKNIERDGIETRTAIAEINRTLIDKLT